MKDKFLFKNYTEEQMNEFCEQVNNIILALKDAQVSKSVESEATKKLLSLIAKIKDEDSEAISFILENVFEVGEEFMPIFISIWITATFIENN